MFFSNFSLDKYIYKLNMYTKIPFNEEKDERKNKPDQIAFNCYYIVYWTYYIVLQL